MKKISSISKIINFSGKLEINIKLNLRYIFNFFILISKRIIDPSAKIISEIENVINAIKIKSSLISCPNLERQSIRATAVIVAIAYSNRTASR